MRTIPVLVLAFALAGCDFVDMMDSQRYTEDFRQTHKLKSGGRLELVPRE